MNLKLRLFFLFFSLISCGVHAANYEEIKKYIVDYLEEKHLPTVVAADAVDIMASSDKTWKWIELKGINVGYSDAISANDLIAKINNNMKAYMSLRGAVIKSNIQIVGHQTPPLDILEYFSKQCGVSINIPKDIVGHLNFTTESKVPTELACRILIYSFTASGITLKADKDSRILLVVQEDG